MQPGGLAVCPMDMLGAWQGSPEALFPIWQHSFNFWAVLPFQLQQFEKGRRCLRIWKWKVLKGKSFWCRYELWIYSAHLQASLYVTTCQDLMDTIHVGHLLSSFKAGILQVTMLTASVFYRNACLSGICFISRGLALFSLKLLAIPVTEQEAILLCNRLNEWRIRPLKYMVFLMVLLRGTEQRDLKFQGVWQFQKDNVHI